MQPCCKQSSFLLTALLAGTVTLLTVACAAPGEETPALEATPGAEAAPLVSATGEVVPARYAALSFSIPGQVLELSAEEGMSVQEGDVLARLDTTTLDAEVAQAEAALAQAEASLARLRATPRPEEIAAAEERVAAANARVAEAVAQRDALYAGITEDQIHAAQAGLLEALEAQRRAQQAYDFFAYAAENWDSLPHIDELEPGDRTPLDGERDARMVLELANRQVAAAQAYLDDLLDGPDPEMVRVAEAAIWVASAQRDAAQAQLELLRAGPSPQEIAIAEAQVEQARAALEAARVAQQQGTLTAPFDGTVTALYIDPGEWVFPGQPILMLGDLDTLRVETTDLSELDVVRVEVGDVARVELDAFPDLELRGRVTHVAPRTSAGSGVNYTVIVELDEVPPAVRWGMTAFIDIEVDE